MKLPGARLLTTSYEILGGRASALVVVTTSKFHDANPKVYKAFLAAEREAIEIINNDKKKAAQAYLDIAQDRKSTLEEIYNVINDKDYAYTLSPEKVFKTAVFMGKVGTIKDPPAKWQDLFFPDIHDLAGD
jgi:NitT/TauT family transport system substrate-binding protein